ncbi:MAG: DUF3300 domain-containing protein [Syntrophobacter sp.]
MILNNIMLRRTLIGVLVMLLGAPVGVFAQTAWNNESRETFSRAKLDQMLAPIALYSDSLLAQVLIASTYPSEVVEADRWVKENKGLSKDQLNAALDNEDWDLSVKALTPFPQVLAMMDEHLDWTTSLGEAFLDQQKEVMAEIQMMRQKAYAAGNLGSTEQQRVVASSEEIEIQPVNPEVVYVPYYDPGVIYGNWWWPDYPPYAWYPFGGPYINVGLFGFGLGIGVSPFWDWCWGRWNWGGGDMFINVNRTVNINNTNLNVTRGNLRTANLTRVAGRGVADPVRNAALTNGGRAAAGRPALGRLGAARGQGRAGVAGRGSMATGNSARRPSVASVTRGLSRGGTAATRGVAPDRANIAGRGANVARGGAQLSGRAARFNRGANSGGHGFAGANAASRFSGAQRFNGGARFGGHGLAGAGGGASRRGGGSHFGGGAARFGGGANSGGHGFAGANAASRFSGAQRFNGGARFGGHGLAGVGAASRGGGHGFAGSGGGGHFGGGASSRGGGAHFGGGAPHGGGGRRG